MDDNTKSNRGLASSKVSPQRRREIAQMGGKARGRQLRMRAQNGSDS